MSQTWTAAFEVARAAWPRTSVTLEAFTAACAGLTPQAVHAADVVWALSAHAGDAEALKALQARVVTLLGAMGLKPEERAHFTQLAMTQLVVGGASPAKLTKYRGHAALGAWLHVVLTRLVADDKRAAKKEVELDEHTLLGQPLEEVAPELQLEKAKFAPVLSTAFRTGLAALTPRQRNLLRQHYLDGVSLDQLGVVYRVHRASIARWLLEARTALTSSVREEFRRSAGLAPRELDSVLELVRSQLEFTAGVFSTHDGSALPDLTDTQDG